MTKCTDSMSWSSIIRFLSAVILRKILNSMRKCLQLAALYVILLIDFDCIIWKNLKYLIDRDQSTEAYTIDTDTCQSSMPYQVNVFGSDWRHIRYVFQYGLVTSNAFLHRFCVLCSTDDVIKNMTIRVVNCSWLPFVNKKRHSWRSIVPYHTALNIKSILG